MGAICESDAVSYNKLEAIVADYVLLLTPKYNVVNADLPAMGELPKTLWGEVPHTLPMLIYRMIVLLNFLMSVFRERLLFLMTFLLGLLQCRFAHCRFCRNAQKGGKS